MWGPPFWLWGWGVPWEKGDGKNPHRTGGKSGQFFSRRKRAEQRGPRSALAAPLSVTCTCPRTQLLQPCLESHCSSQEVKTAAWTALLGISWDPPVLPPTPGWSPPRGTLTQAGRHAGSSHGEGEWERLVDRGQGCPPGTTQTLQQGCCDQSVSRAEVEKPCCGRSETLNINHQCHTGLVPWTDRWAGGEGTGYGGEGGRGTVNTFLSYCVEKWRILPQFKKTPMAKTKTLSFRRSNYMEIR